MMSQTKGKGGSAKRLLYSISQFTKIGDKVGGRGSKISKNGYYLKKYKLFFILKNFFFDEK